MSILGVVLVLIVLCIGAAVVVALAQVLARLAALTVHGLAVVVSAVLRRRAARRRSMARQRPGPRESPTAEAMRATIRGK